MGLNIVISGCSGGGKSTLLDELRVRGHQVFEEPGRQVVKAELARGGDGLPWADAGKFLALCIECAVAQVEEAMHGGSRHAFFDRSLVDAFNGLEVMGLAPPAGLADALAHWRYHRRVFMTPPWPEIFRNDVERRHSYTESVVEFERLVPFYGRHGYEVVMLPKIAPGPRADFLLAHLD